MIVGQRRGSRLGVFDLRIGRQRLFGFRGGFGRGRLADGANGRTCSGYGSQVGGSGAWQAVGPVAPGGSATASFTEKNPTKGTSCYSLGYSPHAYNTQTNSHRPQKVVAFN